MGEIIAITEANKGTGKELTRAMDWVKKTHHCQHKSVILDKDAHIIECNSCKEHIDPWVYLTMLLNEEQYYWYLHAELKRNVEALKKEQEELTRTVTNLKAQKRRIDKLA